MMRLAFERSALALAVSIVLATPAYAQNCENVKSGLGVNAKPQNASRDIIGQSLDDIRERGWIQFAVYEDFAPWSYRESGELKGVDVDLAELIAEQLGVDARVYATAAGENVDADLRFNIGKGRLIGGTIANVMLHVPYDRELGCRNEQVVLGGQYFNERLAIAYREDAFDDPPVPAYFRFDTVGVENDSISDFYLSGLARGQIVPQMTRYETTVEAMEALAAGEVSAVMGPMGQLEHGAGEGIAIHSPPMPGLAKSQWPLGMAVRHNWRPLYYEVDDIIRAAVEDGRMEAIFAKHGLTWTAPEW